MRQIVENRDIVLPKGGVLQVSMTQQFIEKVQTHFGLGKAIKPSDEHVRMFIFGATKSALDSVETESAA